MTSLSLGHHFSAMLLEQSLNWEFIFKRAMLGHIRPILREISCRLLFVILLWSFMRPDLPLITCLCGMSFISYRTINCSMRTQWLIYRTYQRGQHTISKRLPSLPVYPDVVLLLRHSVKVNNIPLVTFLHEKGSTF